MSDNKFLEAMGATIRSIRKSKSINQTKLAELCNIEKSSLSRLESGQANPTILTLRKVGKALNVSVREFFRE